MCVISSANCYLVGYNLFAKNYKQKKKNHIRTVCQPFIYFIKGLFQLYIPVY